METAVLTKDNILSLIHTQRSQLHSLGVRRLGLFGSFVRGEQHADSDVNVLVEFEPGQKTFDHFMRVAELLEYLLQRRVELVTPEALSPHVEPHILNEISRRGAWRDL